MEEDHLFTNPKLLPASIGMQFVTSLLQKVDEDQKHAFTERLLPYLRSLRRSKEALVEVLQGVSVSIDSSTDTLLTCEQKSHFLTFSGKASQL